MPPKEAAAKAAEEKKPAKGFGGTGEKEKATVDDDAEMDPEVLKSKKLLRESAVGRGAQTLLPHELPLGKLP